MSAATLRPLPLSHCGKSAGDAYLDLVRRYIKGTLNYSLSSAPLQAPLDSCQCLALLKETEQLFKPWLVARGLALSDIVRASAAQVAAALNSMHDASPRLTLCDDILLDNVITLAQDVLVHKVPGDFIEAGAWRGGVTMLMRAALTAFGDTTRKVWVADSFQGLPTPDPDIDLRDAIWNHLMRAIGSLASDLDTVTQLFSYAGLLDARVCFLAGWFKDTLPNAPIERLALLRLDGDWYESTRTALDALYPKLSPGGYVIIDDYRLPIGCARAVDEFRLQHHITAPLIDANHQAVYWQK